MGALEAPEDSENIERGPSRERAPTTHTPATSSAKGIKSQQQRRENQEMSNIPLPN